ncbi:MULTISPECIES: hypothetical protein [unclassified Sphingopyxis]|uniref:hypothetical protein n=1 Tax=unclassified Sphingopyxis TaxID=2614943 RepID=UPI0012E38687|nr:MULTISPECIES: hypothetical protein [unclassified Sphingopyxis]
MFGFFVSRKDAKARRCRARRKAAFSGAPCHRAAIVEKAALRPQDSFFASLRLCAKPFHAIAA